MQFIDKREFAIAALDKNIKTYVVYVIILSAPTSRTTLVYLTRQAEVELLFAEKACVKVLPEYLDYFYIISFNLAMKQPQNTDISCHLMGQFIA